MFILSGGMLRAAKENLRCTSAYHVYLIEEKKCHKEVAIRDFYFTEEPLMSDQMIALWVYVIETKLTIYWTVLAL